MIYPHRFKLLGAMMMCLALAACGGGSGGKASNPPGTPSGTTPTTQNPTPNPAPDPDEDVDTNTGTGERTVTFEALPDPGVAFLRQLNDQGARGFRFVNSEAFSLDAQIPNTPPEAMPTVVADMVYVKDANTTYTYELPVQPALNTAAEFEVWLKEYGARGFVWTGAYSLGASTDSQSVGIMRKDNSSPTTFTYIVDEVADSMSMDQFIENSNAHGQEGYYLVGTTYVLYTRLIDGPIDPATDLPARICCEVGPVVAVYRKESQSDSNYSYRALVPPGSNAGFFEQMNGQGGEGYRFKTSFAYDTSASDVSDEFSFSVANLYEKDLSQNSSFEFYGEPVVDNSADFVQQANFEGLSGSGWAGTYAMPDTDVLNLYFRASGCVGPLCDTRSSLGQ